MLLYYVEEECARLPGRSAGRRVSDGPEGTSPHRRTLAGLLDPSDPNSRSALERIGTRTGIDPVPLLSSPPYRNRLLDAATERLGIGPDAPSLRLAVRPRPAASDTLVFGLVFGAEVVLFQDTVGALQADARAAGTADGPPVDVLGVHHTWLDTQMRARRALVADGPSSVCEATFDPPRPIDVAQILHLARDREIDRHRTLSADLDRAGVPQVNPWGLSVRRADDKILSHTVWQSDAGPSRSRIITPDARALPRGSTAKDVVAGILDLSHGRRTYDIVAQPLRGTEGRQVEVGTVDVGDADLLAGRHPIVAHATDAVLPADDLLLREARGNVRSIVEGERLVLTLRVNVAWDGSAFVAESGFAQVGEDENAFVASRGRGGRILDPGEALRSLCYRADGVWRRIALTEIQIQEVLWAAEEAAHALNRGLPEEAYLKHLGIDLVLEAGASGVRPVILEANARPAGLAASRKITQHPRESLQPKVTDALLEMIRVCHSERSRAR